MGWLCRCPGIVWEPIRKLGHQNLSGSIRPQSSQFVQPLWTDPGIKRGISVRELISTLKKKTKKTRRRGMNSRPFSPNRRQQGNSQQCLPVRSSDPNLRKITEHQLSIHSRRPSNPSDVWVVAVVTTSAVSWTVHCHTWHPDLHHTPSLRPFKVCCSCRLAPTVPPLPPLPLLLLSPVPPALWLLTVPLSQCHQLQTPCILAFERTYTELKSCSENTHTFSARVG